jgi:hypothetical protein
MNLGCCGLKNRASKTGTVVKVSRRTRKKMNNTLLPAVLLSMVSVIYSQ